ncbi:preprotein translocase subunit SecE [Avibacterium gallinarum]|uniref:Protein translocase subunit SecE n=4 Tax=Avibacterium TaxID=292486 RepID=A0A3S4J868_AVIVO|nr:MULTISPECIES: preprotein translocase subunit SecE [Avibacterium]VGM95466.1 Preprotein translocase subunit SecE [uncultured Avibacterium sp.]POY42773.1 preprotein translocase subunit SecE [Avibacterium endocarditidis]POY43365.1 preprotein translocase subunit SecE [Avibacterium gallinarum]TDP27928.1 preprotein translocase subunit SecE [Avibacterium gallinarum]SUB27541.1 preprotein translocase subunit SecE [Avibacterium gallinarum]
MASNIDKKKHAEQAEHLQKSKGLNTFLWLLGIVIIAVAAVGNIYFADQFSTPIRVVAVVILLLVALGILAITNQGTKARAFLKDSRTELRKIVWPTRSEAMQTTLIVMAVTMIVSLILWGLDSIIVSVINFLTNLRF